MAEVATIPEIRVAPKIIKLFSTMKTKADELISQSKNTKLTVDNLMGMFRSETDEKGKEILAEMLTDMGELFLKEHKFYDEEQRDRFIDANIGQDILDESDFTCPFMEYKSINMGLNALKVGLALFGAGAGVALIASWVAPSTFASLTSQAVGISALIGFAGGLFDYLKIEPKNEKTELEIAAIQYLRELRPRFTEWIKSREEAFDERSQPYIPLPPDEESPEGDFPA